MNSLIQEMKDSFLNIRMILGSCIYLAALVIVGYPYYCQMVESGIHTDSVWVSLFQYGVFSEKALCLIPAAAPLAAGFSAEMELKSRFVIFKCPRSGRKKYIVSKLLGAILSGGATVLFAAVLFLLLCIGGTRQIEFSSLETENVRYVQPVLQDMIRLFLTGGLWALIGSLCGILCKNSDISYVSPFVLYYVFTIFQARYYSTSYLLSPRYWSTPIFFSNAVCTGMLSMVLLICSVCYCNLLNGRLKNV